MVVGGATTLSAATAEPVAAAAEPDWPSSVEEGNLGTYRDDRGEDRVTVSVGAGDDGLAFDATKLWIDPGTTVVWEWTGRGGDHNVHAMDGPAEFQSETTAEEGFVYEFTFEAENEGIIHYQCDPHAMVGMHAGVAVGEDVPTVGVNDDGPPVIFPPDIAVQLVIGLLVLLGAVLVLAFFFMRYGEEKTSGTLQRD